MRCGPPGVPTLSIQPLLEFLETQKLSLQMSCFESMYSLYLNWLIDALIQIICIKLWNIFFFPSSLPPSFPPFFLSVCNEQLK